VGPSAAEPVGRTDSHPLPINETVPLSLVHDVNSTVFHPCPAEMRQCFSPPKSMLSISEVEFCYLGNTLMGGNHKSTGKTLYTKLTFKSQPRKVSLGLPSELKQIDHLLK